jgi:hypothetical protein
MKMQCNVLCNKELLQGFLSNYFLKQCTHKVMFICMSRHISSFSSHLYIIYILEMQIEFPIKIYFPSIPHHSQLWSHLFISSHLQSSTNFRSAFKKTRLLYLLRHCFGERYIRDTLLTMSATMSQFGVWPGESIIKFKGSSRSTCTA